MHRPNALYILDSHSFGLIYGPSERADIERLTNVIGPPMTRESALATPSLLAKAEVLLTGWGGPRLDLEFLRLSPELRAVFYGAGSLATTLTDAVWEKSVQVTSAIVANGRPVAEYVLATTLFSLKHGWRLIREARERRAFPGRDDVPGCYGATVGLVSLGVIARELIKLLKPFDLKVVAYDPFLTAEEAQALGVQRVSLEELFARSDVVSLHTPLLPETIGMVAGRHLETMRQGATFINTARGKVVRENEMIKVAIERRDLQFVLDVTDPEPPALDSPLYVLPNVVLTPHMAGSVGNECRRMGRFMVEELERYIAGRPLQWAVTPESIRHSSHSPAGAKLPSASTPLPV